MSLRYPGQWSTNEERKDGIWYRYFLGAAQGGTRDPVVALTLFVGALQGTLEDYASSYLEGNGAAVSRDVSRDGAAGREHDYTSRDGATRYRLLLLSDPPRVYGLLAQGPASGWAVESRAVEAAFLSLGLERPKSYPTMTDAAFGFSLGLPPSWRETRRFASKDTLLLQFTSPALALDGGRQTVHASLTLTVEKAPERGGLDAYYEATLARLGDAFKVASHDPWRGGGGYVDVMTVESAMAESRIKRFFAVRGARGYSLSLEAREDVFPKVHRWADFIASTFSAPPGATPPTPPSIALPLLR